MVYPGTENPKKLDTMNRKMSMREILKSTSKNLNIINSSKFDIIHILYDSDGLSIVIKIDDSEIFYKISFCSNYGFQVFDESRIITRTRELGINKCGLYKFNRTEFMNYVSNLDMQLSFPEGIFHFSIVSKNEIVDIISEDDFILSELR
jgi:hypothetical protein